VLDEDLPETAHDFRVDLIVTPDEIIETGAERSERPGGVIWADLDDEKADQIPVLKGRRP
jgi:5-formyltetrahydrofolate cyclo-ligase